MPYQDDGKVPPGLSARLNARRNQAEQRTTRFRRRRTLVIVALVLGTLALVVAMFAQSSPGAAENNLPIDPNVANPDAVLAEVEGVGISTPIRPAGLTGLGYHPEGETFLELSPRGESLSANPLVDLVAMDSTPEKIQYHVMDRVERAGPMTGALDVGAEAGSTVYSPVSGVITSIRPDPMVEGANVVEIKPREDPNVRVTVSLVNDISSDTGVATPVTAGMTELGSVADSAAVLDPQLSSYTGDAGNHVSVSASTIQ
ncbi:MAG: hypothetical protein WKF28_03980 [Rubrobacteraceae bacterium]